MFKNFIVYSIGVVLIGLAVWVTLLILGEIEAESTVLEGTRVESISAKQSGNTQSEIEPIYVHSDGLSIPWDIAFLPDGTMLVTEREGKVIHVESGKTFDVADVQHKGEGGLLGIVLHPEFESNNLLYLFHTTETPNGPRNRVVRYRFDGESFTFDTNIIENLPGARYHDGGRIIFGPDGYLYITLGDAGSERTAQDTNSLAGSILRIDAEGNVPEDNPFGNAIYSYGHRNPQGLAWDENGQLWSTEHGRSGVYSGFDELNRIEKGKNYGWPDSQGDEVAEGTVGPAAHSGPRDTWAPASAVYYNGSIYFGGLRGEALYEAKLNENHTSVVEVTEHFKGDFGRIRTIVLGPDNLFYLTTSNRDGRGDPTPEDDRIIRINPRILER